MSDPELKNALPPWASFLLKLFTHGELLEELEGDMLDNYNWRLGQEQQFSAKFWLFIDVVFSVRFFSNKSYYVSNMKLYSNYFKVYYRQQYKNRGQFTFHLLGLTIGLICFLSLYSYHAFENSFDSYHPDANRLYRVERIEIKEDKSEKRQNGTSYLIPQTLEEAFPEVETVASIINGRHSRGNFQYPKGEPWHGFKSHATENNFFKIFTYTFLEGSPENALNKLSDIVITRHLRDVVFNGQPALGKSVWLGENERIVTAVIEDIPDNTHFQFDYLIHFENNFQSDFWDKSRLQSDWNYANFLFNYVKVKDNFSKETIEAKLNKIYSKHKKQGVFDNDYILRPVSDIHLKSHSDWELMDNGNPNNVRLLLALGIVILLLTSINFTIISIARSAYRVQEMGIRKVLGSNKIGIAHQLILENLFTLIIAFLLSYTVIFLLQEFLPVAFPFQVYTAHLFTIKALLMQLGSLLFIAILTAIYPIFLVLNIQPIAAIKGMELGKGKKFGIMRLLIFVQVFFSIGLIASTFYFNNQMDYLMSKDPGFESESIVFLERYVRDERAPAYASFKEQLLTIPGVESVTCTVQLPLRWPAGQSYELVKEGEDKEKGILHSRGWVGYDYFKTLEVDIVKGREFSLDFPTDTAAIIITESSAKAMNLENPIGTKMNIFFRGGDVVRTRTIIGIAKDFNFRSFHSELLPSYYMLAPNAPVVTINLNDAKDANAIEQIRAAWGKFSPNEAYNLTFFKDYIASQYKEDLAARNSISLLSVVMIVLAALGIFGMSAFIAKKQTKQIAVRKVLGAKVDQLFLFQTKQYLIVTCIGFLASIFPFYYLIENWLGQYAYHITIDGGYFIITLIIVLLIVLLIAGMNTLKVALTNPVNILKND